MNPKAFFRGWGQLNRDLRLLTISLLFWGLGTTIWSPLFSIHLSDLGASPAQIGLVFSIASLVIAVSSIPGGLIADRYDRKKILIIFWFIGSLSAPILAFAQNWVMAIPGALFYYASIVSTPAINAYVSDCVSEDKLSTSFAVIYATAPISFLVGPPIGGRIAESYGIRTLFVISFLIYLISTAILLFISRQKPPKKDISMRQSFTFLKDKQFLVLCGLAAFLFIYLYTINPFISLHLAEVYGIGFSTIGILSSFTAIGGTLLVLLFGHLGDRWNRIGILALAIGLYALAAIFIGAFAIFPLLPLLAVAHVFRGARDISESLTHSIVASLGREKVAGLYFGAFGLITGFGQAIAPQIGGWLYGNYPNQTFQVFGLFGLVLALFVAVPGRWLFDYFGQKDTVELKTEVVAAEIE